MRIPIFRGMIRRHRRARIGVLLEQVKLWEAQGLDLFSQIEELTDPEEPLGVECRRVQDLLAG